ncbi:MAG: hypothetical protein ED557_00270 [Balneola sp.]|nr:MAG: hypothetical protein ED557_00270 [Balneola sp.]
MKGISGEDSFLETRKKVIKRKRSKRRLVIELNKTINEDYILVEFGLDTSYIKNNPEELLQLYDGYYRDRIDWNFKQKQHIRKKLSNLDNYRKQLQDYLSKGCCYTMHNQYRYQFTVKFYKEGSVYASFVSQKRAWGYLFPYTNQNGETIYNYKVDQELHNLFDSRIKVEKPLTEKKLIRYIVNKILDNNIRELYAMSGETFREEINILRTEFDVLSTNENLGGGRYISGFERTLRIELKNDHFFPNVYIQFIATISEGSLYTGDSLKKNYTDILNRIQSNNFISKYLKDDTNSRLDIYYYDNRTVNEYNIYRVNKDSSEWIKHDIRLEWFDRYGDQKARRTSEMVHTGCNYRFNRSFIEEAIFFEIKSNRNSASLWFLLPDDTLLLYHVDSYDKTNATVLDISLRSLNSDFDLPWPCFLFNEYGEIKPR